MRQLVLFDFDGTLANSLEVAVEAYNRVAPGLGAPTVSADDARLRRMNPREALRASAIPIWKVPALVSGVRAGMKAEMHRVPIFPGVEAALTELFAVPLRCGIVSSNSRENIEGFLERHALDRLEILGTGTSLFGKATILRKVVRQLGVDPKQAVYVGDEVRDVAAATEAGMASIAVSWGYADRSALVAERPTAVVDTPTELVRAILGA